MNEYLFSGASTALITPYNEDGKINFSKFEELVDLQIKSGCSAVIICGTTAESSTLKTDEKLQLVTRAVELCKNKIQVIAGSGSNDTANAVKLTDKMTEIGVDGLLVVTPYYNKTSQDGLYEHYNAISKATDKPIIVYNVPSRTGMSITLDTYVKMQIIDNIKGIKEASGNLPLLAALIDCCGERYKYYCGNDDIILPFLSLGGDGIISVVGNLIPDVLVKLCNHFFGGDISSAAKLQLNFTPLINALSLDINPMTIKCAMNLCGMNVGGCRLPLVDVNDETKKRLNNELKRLKLK